MENETHTIETPVAEHAELSDREMLVEIYKNSKKTKNYMKWSLIITIALVVIPLLATLLVIPFALRSLTSIYSPAGIEDITGGSGATSSSVQDLIKQYTK